MVWPKAPCRPARNVVAIATGDFHTVALKGDGRVVTWGFNTAGQCTVPAGLANIEAIAARGNHTMVLIHDQTLPARSLPAWGK